MSEIEDLERHVL